MEYTRFNNKIVLRLDIGDEIVESINTVIVAENIRLASVTGIGALNKVTMGFFTPAEKTYHPHELEGDYELLALNGNITQNNNEPYIHLHITLGDENGHALGGHLNAGFISVTGEIFIDIIEGDVDRKVDPTTGLNILKF
ncbi:MAG: DNA-binding protein [Erysipelothrix sp.]|nr:DNA-binding protein [Erysipelothrix sp.]